jgi:enoyl-CoA hydratase
MSVATSRHGRVLVVEMNRAAKRNALNGEITAGIDAAMNELEDDPELWCGILAGDESVIPRKASAAMDGALTLG